MWHCHACHGAMAAYSKQHMIGTLFILKCLNSCSLCNLLLLENWVTLPYKTISIGTHGSQLRT